MNLKYFLFPLLLTLVLVVGCDSDEDEPAEVAPKQEAVEIVNTGKTVVAGETHTLKYRVDPTQVAEYSFSIDGTILEEGEAFEGTKEYVWSTSDLPMGRHSILLNYTLKGGQARTKEAVKIILPASTPKEAKVTVINTFPHDRDAYTQGLEFDGKRLLESTGQNGQSSLRETIVTTGQVIKKHKLDDAYFGEGITIIGDTIFQITWTSRTGFIYDRETLEQLGTFDFNTPTGQGWGLTNDGAHLILSDGSHQLYYLDAKNLSHVKTIEVYDNVGPVRYLNELELVNGKIYANIFQSDILVIIDPNTGRVEKKADLSMLRNMLDDRNGIDVLNGIAYNADEDKLYVTGKLWPNLFEIKIQ